MFEIKINYIYIFKINVVLLLESCEARMQIPIYGNDTEKYPPTIAKVTTPI